MKRITFADGTIRLNGEDLPAILVSLRIDGKVRYDEQKLDGMSGKTKTPMGWEDHSIVATMVLTTDNNTDCYEKLEVFSAIFRSVDSKANPQIFTVTNRHAHTRGVRQVVFDRLESSETSENDTILISMGFSEYEPPIIRAERAVAKTPSPREMAEKAQQMYQSTTGPTEDARINGRLDK